MNSGISGRSAVGFAGRGGWAGGGAGWGGRGFGGYGGYGGFGRGFGYGFGYGLGLGFGYPFFGYGFGGGLLSGLGFGLGYGLLGGFGGFGYGGYGGYGGGGYGGYGGSGCGGYGGYGGGYGGYGGGYGSGNYGYNPCGQGYAGYNDPNAYANLSPVATTAVAGQSNLGLTQSTTPLPTNDPAASAKDFASRGETAFKAGDYNGAVYAWRHSVLDDPQNGVLTMMLGQALFATGKFEEAAGATQAAMRQLPKDQWGVVVSHSQELYGNIQDYTNQLRALEQGLKDKLENPALRFLTGFHYAYLGFPKEAVDQLDRGLKIAPRDEMAKQLRDEMQAKLSKPVSPRPAPSALETPQAMSRPLGTRAPALAAI